VGPGGDPSAADHAVAQAARDLRCHLAYELHLVGLESSERAVAHDLHASPVRRADPQRGAQLVDPLHRPVDTPIARAALELIISDVGERGDRFVAAGKDAELVEVGVEQLVVPARIA
jgi:hypothetical protein